MAENKDPKAAPAAPTKESLAPKSAPKIQCSLTPGKHLMPDLREIVIPKEGPSEELLQSLHLRYPAQFPVLK